METQYKRKLVSHKKIILWLAGIIIVTLVMFYFDKQKVYKEEEPPMPVVSLGEQKAQVLLASFTWNGGEVRKELKDLVENLNYERVEFRDELHVEFPEGEEPIYISRGLYDSNGEVVIPPFNMLDENANFLTNSSSIQTLSIKAFWKNGRRAEYIVPLNIREVPPEKEYLSPNKAFHSLLVVYGNEPQGDTDVTLQINHESPKFLLGSSHRINLEMAKEDYPELQITSTPSYLLFDQEKELFRTESVDSLLQYVKENTYESKENKEGIVTKLDSRFGIVYVDNIPFLGEDLRFVKVGQKVKIEITNVNKEVPYYRMVTKIDVIEETDDILLNKEWLSRKVDELTLLVVGNSQFTEPFKKPQKEDLKLVGNINIKKSLHSIEKPSVFVFNSKELVFQTHDYDSLLKYLFETEQMLPVKKEIQNQENTGKN